MTNNVKKQNCVFIKDSNGNPIGIIHPAVCRKLLKQRKAFVTSRHPFGIQLKKGEIYPYTIRDLSIGIDPGVKHTGISIFKEVNKGTYIHRYVYYSGVIEHKSNISKKLANRRAYRQNRNSRKKRQGKRWRSISKARLSELYQKGWVKRDPIAKKPNWLPPSVRARLENIANMLRRLLRFLPRYNNQHIYIEDVKFTPEAVDNAFKNNTGITSYKRAYIFHRDGHKCQYCGYDFIKNKFKRKPEIDHIYPKSRGGGNERHNLILSCQKCNQDKGNRLLNEWDCGYKRKPYVDKIIKRGYRPAQFRYSGLSTITRQHLPLFIMDSVVTDNTSYVTYMDKKIIHRGIPDVSSHQGWNTQRNREINGLPKEHYIDAACVGPVGISVDMRTEVYTEMRYVGYRNRQFVVLDKYGFPKKNKPKPKSKRSIKGLMMGDMVKYRCSNNVCLDYIFSVRQDGVVSVRKDKREIFITKHIMSLVYKNDGWRFNYNT